MRHTMLIASATIAIACLSAEAPPVANLLAVSQDAPHASHGRASNNGELTPEQKRAIADVRNATTRFHDLAAAKLAGYTDQFPAGCASSPDGAQGFHYLNPGLVDGKVELLKPELVMYEPGPNGQMQLVGVDYIVPLTESATAPTLLGMPFAKLEALGVWAIHIWAWRPNPSGMFSPWNPKVSCRFAQ